MSRYPQEHVDRCRAQIAGDIAAFEALGTGGDATAVARLEPAFFNAQLLALDHRFGHRARGIEGKDGNPLNEVRVLANSLMEHDGVMTADKGIRLTPEGSVLGYETGDDITLSKDQFKRLCEAFLAEIERRYR